jgi:hypothetical protein
MCAPPPRTIIAPMTDVSQLTVGAPIAPAVRRRSIVAIAVVVALAVAGFALALGIGGGPSPYGSPSGPFGLNQDIPTSFGAVAIDGLMRTAGPARSHRDEIQAFVTLTNLTDRPIDYSPSQFRLLVGARKTPVGDMNATFRPGRLLPGADFSAQLKFAGPPRGTPFWMEFTDPRRSEPMLIDLTRVGKRTPENAFDHFFKR